MIVIILLAVVSQVEQPVLPVVEERYDAIIVSQHNDSTYSFGRAYFLRDCRIIAERVVDDEWTFSTSGERPLLLWNDYGTCRRRVECDVLIWGSVAPVKQEDPAGPWWGAARNMRDLLAPQKAD